MLQKEKNGPGHEKCTKSGENPGRAHKRSVTVVLNPIVLLSVGKNALKLSEMTIDVRAKANHHTFQSLNAILSPAR